ncbi:MAG: hypothetical protein JWO08_4352 [Verrucomicrobiaceae bacterium]|nr:hypothetical protein [Verrucomicrobiaceae bacterium]
MPLRMAEGAWARFIVVPCPERQGRLDKPLFRYLGYLARSHRNALASPWIFARSK